mmetsp:Transcript_30014/g.92822  ORF Transcript_30014/g.92822 Transcript_30014/m.92822 type:complete len:237 (+) Transcript_30014:1090-1800(+)
MTLAVEEVRRVVLGGLDLVARVHVDEEFLRVHKVGDERCVLDFDHVGRRAAVHRRRLEAARLLFELRADVVVPVVVLQREERVADVVGDRREHQEALRVRPGREEAAAHKQQREDLQEVARGANLEPEPRRLDVVALDPVLHDVELVVAELPRQRPRGEHQLQIGPEADALLEEERVDDVGDDEDDVHDAPDEERRGRHELLALVVVVRVKVRDEEPLGPVVDGRRQQRDLVDARG